MPLYIHRTTFQRLPSTSPASLPEPVTNYVRNPDEAAIESQPSKYWILTGDAFTLMDQAARDAVDAAEEVASLDAIADQLDQTRSIMKAFAEVVLDEINGLRDLHSLNPRTLAQLKTAVRSKL